MRFLGVTIYWYLLAVLTKQLRLLFCQFSASEYHCFFGLAASLHNRGGLYRSLLLGIGYLMYEITNPFRFNRPGVWVTVTPPITVSKAWGYERQFGNVFPAGECGYCGKILVVRRGISSSIHYHRNKVETFCCVNGQLALEIWDHKDALFDYKGSPVPNKEDVVNLGVLLLNPGCSVVTLNSGTFHRFWSVTDETTFVEFSSPDFAEDSYRIVESGPTVGFSTSVLSLLSLNL